MVSTVIVLKWILRKTHSITFIIVVLDWQNAGKSIESCTRVSSLEAGGRWVFGRMRGQRRVIILVEGCSTLNEMHSVINDIFDGVLGSVMI